jgi:hypothetical protein
MTVKIKYLILAFCLTVLAFSGCGKYEDGPTISFRSADKRIIQLWKFTQRTVNGTDITLSCLNDSVDIHDKGLYSYYSASTGDATGVWDYENHKRGINIKSSGSMELDSGGLIAKKYYSNNITATIKKLKKNELWIEGDEVIHDSISYAGSNTVKDATRTILWHLVPVE